MTNEEDLLRKLAVAQPSEDLDRRMERLFATAGTGRSQGIFTRPVALWQCAAVCVLGILAGWWFRPPSANVSGPGPEAATVRYIIYVTDPKLLSVFDATQGRNRTGLEDVILHPKVITRGAVSESPAAEGDAPGRQDQRVVPKTQKTDKEI